MSLHLLSPVYKVLLNLPFDVMDYIVVSSLHLRQHGRRLLFIIILHPPHEDSHLVQISTKMPRLTGMDDHHSIRDKLFSVNDISRELDTAIFSWAFSRPILVLTPRAFPSFKEPTMEPVVVSKR